MKQLLILCLSLTLLVACKDKKDTRDDRRTTTEKDDYRNTDEKKKVDDRNSDDRNNEDDRNTNSDNEDWSRTDVNKFLADCEGTATPNVGEARAVEYCDCMLKKMKRIYSSLADAERKMAGITQTEINEFAADCNR